jgi:hypothetical protein
MFSVSKEKPEVLYKSNTRLSMLQSRMSQYAGHDEGDRDLYSFAFIWMQSE